jgi:hypothetical protein
MSNKKKYKWLESIRNELDNIHEQGKLLRLQGICWEKIEEHLYNETDYSHDSEYESKQAYVKKAIYTLSLKLPKSFTLPIGECELEKNKHSAISSGKITPETEHHFERETFFQEILGWQKQEKLNTKNSFLQIQKIIDEKIEFGSERRKIVSRLKNLENQTGKRTIGYTLLEIFKLGYQTALEELKLEEYDNSIIRELHSESGRGSGRGTQTNRKDDKAEILENFLNNPPKEYRRKLEDIKGYKKEYFVEELSKLFQEYSKYKIKPTTFNNHPYHEIILAYKK